MARARARPLRGGRSPNRKALHHRLGAPAGGAPEGDEKPGRGRARRKCSRADGCRELGVVRDVCARAERGDEQGRGDGVVREVRRDPGPNGARPEGERAEHQAELDTCEQPDRVEVERGKQGGSDHERSQVARARPKDGLEVTAKGELLASGRDERDAGEDSRELDPCGTAKPMRGVEALDEVGGHGGPSQRLERARHHEVGGSDAQAERQEGDGGPLQLENRTGGQTRGRAPEQHRARKEEDLGEGESEGEVRHLESRGRRGRQQRERAEHG